VPSVLVSAIPSLKNKYKGVFRTKVDKNPYPLLNFNVFHYFNLQKFVKPAKICKTHQKYPLMLNNFLKMSSKHVLEAKILSIAQDLVGRSLSERDFCSHFGGPSVAIEKLWNLICMRNDLPKSWGVDDLLIGLFFLQNPGTPWSTSSS
jgi:hypothetical protein